MLSRIYRPVARVGKSVSMRASFATKLEPEIDFSNPSEITPLALDSQLPGDLNFINIL